MKKYLLPREGRFYKANLHSHSTVSDGKLTPEEMKEHYKNAGYSILAYTDHDVFVAHPELTDENFLVLHGYEASVDEKSEKGPYFSKECHFCLIPLFFWVSQQTGDMKYHEMAIGHYNTSAKYLVREDGSSYHHYQFDPKTKEPLYGVTHQGNGDESCWTRGHAWLVYGYPTAYKYTKDQYALDVAKAVSYYFMNTLPDDNIPYWDTDFEFPSFEPRDSSASAVVACGLLEMCKYLPDSDKDKELFRNAAEIMIEAIIDKCICDREHTDAIITHVTGSVPHNEEIDSCETYGDYFFFEALVRLLKPEIEFCW